MNSFQAAAAKVDVSLLNAYSSNSTTNNPAGGGTISSVDGCSRSTNSSIRNNNMQRIFEALKYIPVEDKCDLVEALVKSPNLVQKESNPKHYLRYCNDDIEAAKGLCTYWKNRKAYFKERAYIPMNITCQHGALNNEDIAYLLEGFIRVLPKDEHGHHVLFVDKERLFTLPEDVRKRCSFYILHVVVSEMCHRNKERSSNTNTDSNNAFVSIVLVNDFRDYDGFLTGDILAGFPIRNHSTQIFCKNTGNNSSQYSILASFAATFARLFGIESLKSSILHFVSSPEECFNKLQPIGFQQDCLPIEVGGLLSLDNHAKWMRHRVTVELAGLNHMFPEVVEETNQESTQVLGNNSTIRNTGTNTQYSGQIRNDNNHIKVNPIDRNNNTSLMGTTGSLLNPFLGDSSTNNILNNSNNAASAAAALSLSQSSQYHQDLLRLTNGLSSEHLLTLATYQALTTSSNNNAASLTPRTAEFGNVGGLLYPNTTTNVAAAAYPQVNNSNNNNSALFVSNNVAATTSIQGQNRDDNNNRGVAARTLQKQPSNAHASTSVLPESIALVETSKILFVEAMKLMPKDEKLAYEEAMNKAPHLFEKECNPIKFLRAEDFDAWKAAKRMANYWNMRKELFGHRAFLPMTQNGQGALTHDDVVNLGGGYAAVVPKGNDGKFVVIFDRSRQLNKEGNNIPGMRCGFYIMSVMSEDEENQKSGVEALSYFMTPRSVDYGGQSNIDRAVRLSISFPVKFSSVHFVACPPKTSHRNMVETAFSIATGIIKRFFPGRANLYTADSAEDILHQLEAKGFTAEGLPSSLGGKWKYEDFTHWLRQRKKYEEEMTNVSAPWIYEPVASVPNNTKFLTNEERKAHKRRLNIIHSRQKRERRKAEMEELEQKCVSLKKEHKKLKTENNRLENLLQNAKEKIETM